MQDRLNALGARLLTLLRWILRLLLWPFRALWRIVRWLPGALWRFVRWAPRAIWRLLRWMVAAPFRFARWTTRKLAGLARRLFAAVKALLRWPITAMRERQWRKLFAMSVALMLTAALAIGGAIFLRGRLTRAPIIYPTVAALTLEAPATIAAGTPLTVTITARPPVSGTIVILTAQGTLGLAAQAQPLHDGVAIFTLPGANTSGAGALALSATAGAAQTTATVIVQPGRAADPLLTLAGPRSVMAGGDEAMVVTLPLDAQGNAVADATLITVQTQHPPPPGKLIGPVDTFTQGTRNLLAALRVRSRAVAGPLLLAAFGSSGHSMAQTVRVQPAPPLTVTISATPDQAPADGETAISLQTSRLADEFGNQILDGVVVFFLVESSDGTRRWLPATVIDGVATTLLPAPLAPVEQTVRAWVAGVLSPPVTVSFRPGAAVRPFTLVTARTGDATAITAGPLLGELNQLAPDDTVVTFTFFSRNDRVRTLTGKTVYGYATVTIYDAELPAGDYTVVATVGATEVNTAVTLLPPAAPNESTGVTP